jgi:hypothetical protein
MFRLAVLSIGVCLSLPASAATLNAVQGQVLINHGDGFQRVTSGAEAREGDLVMANPGGSAKLLYPGGCVTEVKPGSVVTVNDGSKCPQAMLVGNDCENSTDPRPRCGYIWWPVAVGVALPLAGFLISAGNNDPGRHHVNNNNNNNEGNGGGGGPDP